MVSTGNQPFRPLSIAASKALRRVRPAAVASGLGALCGLNRRKPYQTRHGLFVISPISNMGATLLNEGEYEPQMIAVLHRHLKSGDVFVDLGANEGYFSVIGSGLVGASGKVIAVEPQSRLQSVIRTNLELNRCSNVEIQQVLVSGENREHEITLTSQINTGASSLYTGHQKLHALMPTERIRSVTLETFLALAGIARCDFMKIDIEGAEWDVIMNAGSVLRSGAVRRFVLDIHHTILATRGLRGIDLHNFILDCGYSLDDSLGPWVYAKAD